MENRDTYLYQAVIHYKFDNGEEILFSQKKMPNYKISKRIDYVDAHGKKQGIEIFFSIFNEARVCAFVGSLSNRWGYGVYAPCLGFKRIRLCTSTLDYMLDGSAKACCYKNKVTKYVLDRNPYLIEETEQGSIRATLRVMMEMMNEDDKRVWSLEDFM